jgi:hypothetical protein
MSLAICFCSQDGLSYLQRRWQLGRPGADGWCRIAVGCAYPDWRRHGKTPIMGLCCIDQTFNSQTAKVFEGQ